MRYVQGYFGGVELNQLSDRGRDDMVMFGTLKSGKELKRSKDLLSCGGRMKRYTHSYQGVGVIRLISKSPSSLSYRSFTISL
jgi:hypothetical protein